MEELKEAGIGSVEITPIYGIDSAESRHIDYLSPRWMDMYQHVKAEAKRLDMSVDMATGTGWPFGGPDVMINDAACKAIFQQYKVKGPYRLEKEITVNDRRQTDVATIAAVVAYGQEQKIELTDRVTGTTLLWDVPEGDWTIWTVFNGKTLQKVKRAAPGGEGWVINHYSRRSLDRYLTRFDRAFTDAGASWPDHFFNDSYEVYGANWSENLMEEFEKRRGYRLQEYLPELNREGDPDICARVVCDYRQTIAELLLNEFTIPWTDWAHARGSVTRSQAHGSPGNLIDLYAAVDIPECESFGRTFFDIPGLRIDSGMKESDSHPSVLKYASSAAHITGKKQVSSETFTWLTEHFRTSLSQMKPEIDQMFVAGVNHMHYHGSPYSPKDVPWPGWLFYASVNLNANNTIFRDIKGLNEYITRTQSFLQHGEPDNDFLVYLPIYDIWQQQSGMYLMFDIHRMKHLMPAFFEWVVNIQSLGFDVDYISDRYILQTSVCNHLLQTPGASYKAIIVPDVRYMPYETLAKLIELAKDGATVIFTDRFPEDVPGLHDLERRRNAFQKILADIRNDDFNDSIVIQAVGKGNILSGKDYLKLLQASSAKPEEIKVEYAVQTIRRKHKDGHFYFIAMLENNHLDNWVGLSVNAQTAMIYDPLTGEKGKANLRKRDGKTEIYLQLAPGQSLIVKTFDRSIPDIPDYLF
jgi:hypothetical protein